MKVNPKDAPCGAEITGVDLSCELSAEQVTAIRQAWLQYHVLVFPEQDLNVDDLARYSLYFGTFGDDPFFNPIETHPNIAAIRRDANEKTSLFAENWHTDWSFQPKPPIGTCLYGITIPPQGGDTLFANQHKAYDELPIDLKEKIENLKAVHSAASGYSPDGIYGEDNDSNAGRSMDILISEEARRTQSHPLIRPHTETGRPAIYSTAGYIERFEELGEEESKKLLRDLYRYQGSAQFVYRHKWQPNMLVMWDNRSVLHKATGGYDGFDRLLYRTTISEFD
ncbi:MAG: TauD/TfdA family dioxygenase [Gammaproteobacteria bacterium]|nr:TauD/TfdA family dioxygenase [Gammaproteobacteria bacterium]MDD9957446.1 TauD/TfdA family dioxygenase [Gammaproteobacteria bacterium]